MPLQSRLGFDSKELVQVGHVSRGSRMNGACPLVPGLSNFRKKGNSPLWGNTLLSGNFEGPGGTWYPPNRSGSEPHIGASGCWGQIFWTPKSTQRHKWLRSGRKGKGMVGTRLIYMNMRMDQLHFAPQETLEWFQPWFHFVVRTDFVHPQRTQIDFLLRGSRWHGNVGGNSWAMGLS